jgi:hypothetical protein
MDVRCYYIAQGFVIAGFGYSFSRLNSRIQVIVNLAWYFGWPICRALSIGHFPKTEIGNGDNASLTEAILVCLVGLAVPFTIAVLLAPWENFGAS